MKANQILALGVAVLLGGVMIVGEARAEAPVVLGVSTRDMGTVYAFNGSSIAIRSEGTAKPVRYLTSGTTMIMDENGAPVPHVMLKAGVPVMVDYVQIRDRLIARRVLVVRSLAAGPAIVEGKTPIMTAAVDLN